MILHFRARHFLARHLKPLYGPEAPSVVACLANDVLSASSVSQPAAVIRRDVLANDVKSNSSVTQPAAVIRRDALANDVKSNSSVSQPAAVIGRNILANDVLSPSSVSQPAAVIQRAILANDVKSASFVTNPVVGIVGTLDARDIKSTSTVGNPAVKQLQGLLANDVKSTSSVTQPAALILRGLLANDVTSASIVTKPAVHQGQALLANDALSVSVVSNPTAAEVPAGGTEPGESLVVTYSPGTNRNDFEGQVGVRIGIGTADIPINWIGTRSNGIGGTRTVKLYEWFSDTLVSSATIDLTGKAEGDWVWAEIAPLTLLANGYYALLMDVVAFDGKTWKNPGPVTMKPGIVNIYGCYRSGGTLGTTGINESFVGLDLGWDTIPAGEVNCFANNVISASFVSTPTLVVQGGVIPVPPEIGGGGRIYGRGGYPRRRWEQLLRELEKERQKAQERAEAFERKKDQAKARKAARAASQAIAAALAAADEAAEVAHAGAITRSLEAAAEAKNIAAYLAAMKAAREEAIEMELDDDDEAVLMMVA